MKINNNGYIASNSIWKKRLLSITCRPQRLNARPGRALKKNKKANILIVRIEHLGDVVTNLGLINCIKTTYPESNIDLLMNSSSEKVLRNILVDCNKVLSLPTPIAHCRSNKYLILKLIDTALCYIKAAMIIPKYDAVIFTSHHLYGLQVLGILCKFSIAFYSVGFGWVHNYVIYNKEDWSISERISAIAYALTGKSFIPSEVTYSSKRLTKILEEKADEDAWRDAVIIAPKAGTRHKSLRSKEIRQILGKEYYAKILVVGDYDDEQIDTIKKHCNKLTILGVTKDIYRLTKALSVCKKVITTDSFIAHLAATICTCEISIWFRERKLMKQWAPPGKLVNVFCLDELT